MLSVSRKEFAEHLSYLQKNANVISLDTAVTAVKENAELPRNSVVITIDDGYRDAYEVAFPLLQDFKMNATLYVITNFLNRKIWLWTDLMRYLIRETKRSSFEVEGVLIAGDVDTDEQMISLADGVNRKLKAVANERKWELLQFFFDEAGLEISDQPTRDYDAISWSEAIEMDQNGVAVECHTVNHPILTNISTNELEKELSDSKKEIEQRLNKKCLHFCYPNGSFDDVVADAAKTAGFESAVTTNYGFVSESTDLFRLKRIDGQPSIANFAQSVSGFEKFREKIGI